MPTLAELLLPPFLAFVLAAVLGFLLALLRTRARCAGWLALDAAVVFPAFVPVPVLAPFLLAAIPGMDRITPWILAAGLSALAFAYVPMALALTRTAAAYRDTARLQGLGAFAAFFRIVLPLTWPALGLGSFLALVRVAAEWLVVIGALDRITPLTAGMAALALGAAVATAFAFHRLRPIA